MSASRSVGRIERKKIFKMFIGDISIYRNTNSTYEAN